MKTMRVMRMKLPSQEVILVWVFVKYFHFQLLTRYFMDNHLTHTHTREHRQIHKNIDIWANMYYSSMRAQSHANRSDLFTKLEGRK